MLLNEADRKLPTPVAKVAGDHPLAIPTIAPGEATSPPSCLFSQQSGINGVVSFVRRTAQRLVQVVARLAANAAAFSAADSANTKSRLFILSVAASECRFQSL